MKKTVEANFFKGDPHDRPGDIGPVRFVRFEKLPDTYGSGPGSDYLEGCSPSNAYFDGPSNFARLENSSATRLNRGWHVTFAGDWNRNFIRGDLFYFAFDDARSYGHTLAAASGTTITDTITMYDTDTVTGLGTFTNIRVSNYNPATRGQTNVISGYERRRRRDPRPRIPKLRRSETSGSQGRRGQLSPSVRVPRWT